MQTIAVIGSAIRPRELCTEEANEISDLMRMFDKYYGLRRANLLMPHCLLSALIVHLANSKQSESSRRYLEEGLNDFKSMAECHHWATRCLKIMCSLAVKWGLTAYIPQRLIEGASSELSLPTFPTAAAATNIPTRPEMRNPVSMQQPPSLYHTIRPEMVPIAPTTAPSHLHATSPMKAPTPHPYHAIQQPNISSHSAASTAPPQHAHIHPAQVLPQLQSSAPDQSVFWHIPGQGVPLMGTDFDANPMDLQSMLAQVSQYEQLGRDGFQISDAYLHADHEVLLGGLPIQGSAAFQNWDWHAETG